MKKLFQKAIIFFLFLPFFNGCNVESNFVSPSLQKNNINSIDGTYVAAYVSVYQFQDEDLPPIGKGNWVKVHKVLKNWETETSNWNMLNMNYENTAIDSLLADKEGWHTFNVSSIVANMNKDQVKSLDLLFEQNDSTLGNLFFSSEYHDAAKRPKLDLYFKSESGITKKTIQNEIDGKVSDTYIWEAEKEMNFSEKPYLWVGNYIPFTSGEKRALIKFDIEF